MAEKGIEQRHLFLLYQSVVLSVIDYELGLTTMAQTNLLKLDRVHRLSPLAAFTSGAHFLRNGRR